MEDERMSGAQLPSPVSVHEAMARQREDLRVPDYETLSIGPFTRHSKHFQIVEIREFTDLHRLRFVPDTIREKDAVEAVRADDAAHYRNAREHAGASDCACEDAPATARGPKRRHFQDHFWQLVQPLYRQPITFADTAVLHPYRHVQAWLNRGAHYYTGISLLENIFVGKSATLRMTPSVSTLHANEVTVEDNGRLRFEGKRIHVTCNVLNGPSLMKSALVSKYLTGYVRERQEN